MGINNMDGREDALDIRRDTATDETNSNAEMKKKRTWKKPKDKPMRPLSAYNMFFQNQRERIIAGKLDYPTPEEIEASVTKLLKSKRGPKKRQDRISHGQISFGDLARTIATRWKAIDPTTKAVYNKFAGQEKIRYKKEVVVWKEKKEKEHEAKMRDRHNSLLNSSTSLNDSVSSLVSSVTSLPASLTSSFNPSDSINSLGHYSSGGLAQDNMIQRQQDILRQQMGFIDSKPHARIGGGGNDSVVRKIPNLGMQSYEFSRYSGDDSERSLTSAHLDTSSFDQKFAHIASDMSMLDDLSTTRQIRQQQQSLQHQLQLEQQHQLLLQMQEQQLHQLEQLQQTRNENSRMGDMDYTNLSQLRSLSAEHQNYDQFRNVEQLL